MALCTVCRAAGPAPPADPPQAGSVLVLRVWAEPDGLRARLLAGDGRQTVAVVQGTDAISQAVRAWLIGL